MKVRNARQLEGRRLASHLTASVAYLWLKPVMTIVLGSLLGVTLIADRPRVAPMRPERKLPGNQTPKIELRAAQH